MDKVLADDPVAGLIGIPLPPAVTLWPTTWPARIIVAVVVLGVLAASWWLLRNWYVNRYRRAALSDLATIERTSSGARAAGDIAVLVRRTALAVFPRESVADLSGPAWLKYLDASYGGAEFSQGAGRLLATGPYENRPLAKGEFTAVVDLARRWIRTHHA